MIKGGRHSYLLFNEEDSPVTATIKLGVNGNPHWLDPATGAETIAAAGAPVTFAPHELKLLLISR